MTAVLDQVVQWFEQQGLKYQLNENADLLVTAFPSPDGGFLVGITPYQQGVLITMHNLAEAQAGEEASLAGLAARLPIVLMRDPADDKISTGVPVPGSRDGVSGDDLLIGLQTALEGSTLFRAALRYTRQGLSAEAAIQRGLEDIASPPHAPEPQESPAEGASPPSSQAGEQVPTGNSPASERAALLVDELRAASDKETFLREHLSEFDDEVLMALGKFAEQAEQAGYPDLAGGLRQLGGVVLRERVGDDPVAQRDMLWAIRLVESASPQEVAAIVEQWPEALSQLMEEALAETQQAALAAGNLSGLEKARRVQAWIEAERAARPLWTALSTLVQQESWDDSRRAAWADPQLHDHAALVGLEELARIASVRGDDELAEVYLVHRARLAHWQATDFAPEKVTVATSQTASVGLLLQELTMLADQHHASSARRRIELAHAILDQVSRSDESQVWGVVQRMLGDAHWAFYEQSGSVEEADLAEAAYKAALEIITREASPTAWASVQATLGNLREHRYNMTGEEHWADAADSAYRAALEVRTLDAERDDWIRTQSDRAHLLSSRYENTSDYRWGELADAAFRSIFPVVDKEVNPVTWASTQRRWADLQQSRYAHGSEEHLAQVAESAYRSAIEVYAPELYPESWAGTQLNLGNLLSTRYRRTNDERWAGAAEMAYRSALQVFTRSTESGDWAKVQHNMAGLLAFRFEATREARFADDAEAAYRAALEIYDPQAVPAFAISPQRGLARLLMLRERWVEAAAAFEVALQTVERQYLTAPGDAERRQIMADNAHLYQSHAYCLLRQGNPLGALARLEEGWARSLTEQFALEETAYARYGVDGLERLQARRRALRAAEARLDAVTAQLLVTTSNWEQNTLAETRNASVAEVRSAYDKLRAEIRALQLEPALLTPAGLQTLQLPHETAAVALLLGTDGHALVLYKGTVSSVPLPQFGEDYLYELVHDHSQISEWTDIFPPGFTDALRASLDAKEADGDTSATNATLNVALDEARGHMQAILDSLAASRGNYQAGWYQSYNLTFYLLHELGGKRHPQAQQAAYDGWKATVVRTLDSLYKHFWTPIVRALPTDVHHILLLVGGDAALMPFHAAAPSSLTVAYVPSLGVWQHSDLAAKGRTSDALLLATPAPLEDLAFTAVEGEWLMDRFSGQGPGRSLRLDQAEATVAKVLHAAHGRGIVHFSGHARYEWLDPLSSGLVCSDGILTVAHARHQWDLSTTRLVTLSACESGIADVFRSGGEWVGLPASLVEAGAPAVVASLWPVNDMSTAFLMDRFYALWREPGAGRTIAGALREAALWMRNASWAELGARLAQSNLTPERRGLLATLLGKLQTPTRNRQPDIVGDFIERLAVADPDERPFAAPYYWAAFAAYGAVL